MSLETLSKPFWNRLETLLKHFETPTKPFGNSYEAIWNSLEMSRLKTFWNLIPPLQKKE